MTTTTRARRAARHLIAGIAVLVLAACGQQGQPAGQPSLSGTVTTGGSSTLGPLTRSIGDRFSAYNPGVQVGVDITSTGDGLAALCAGKLDVANASREMTPAEQQACADAGVKVTKILAANDAISIIVNRRNTWASCLTTKELGALWGPQSTVRSWKDVRAGFPDVPVSYYGPDATSGTLDLFTTAINGTDKAIRADYTGSQDDNVTIQGVRDNKGGIGFLGHSYAVDNEDIVATVAIDAGDGCVTPSATTVREGTYRPLSRPLYVYVNHAALKRAEVKAFMEYYVQWARNVAVDSNFVPVTETQRQEARAQLAQAIAES